MKLNSKADGHTPIDTTCLLFYIPRDEKKFWVVQSLESSNFKALHNHTPGISRDSDQNLLILRGLD